MKKILLLLVLMLVLVGCGKANNNNTEGNKNDTTTTEGSDVLTEETEGTETQGTEVQNSEVVNTEVQNSEAQNSETPTTPTTPPASEKVETVKYTYKDLSQVLYAKSDVNVRDLPSANGKKLGGLTRTQKVKVTGQCNETSWYRIEFNGGVGYVSSDYLAQTPTYGEYEEWTPEWQKTIDAGYYNLVQVGEDEWAMLFPNDNDYMENGQSTWRWFLQVLHDAGLDSNNISFCWIDGDLGYYWYYAKDCFPYEGEE